MNEWGILTTLDLDGVALGGGDEDFVLEEDGDLGRGGHVGFCTSSVW